MVGAKDWKWQDQITWGLAGLQKAYILCDEKPVKSWARRRYDQICIFKDHPSRYQDGLHVVQVAAMKQTWRKYLSRCRLEI